MSFEYITDKDVKKTLSKDEVQQLAERISSDFENYNSRRRQNLNQSEELINEIFFKKSFTNRRLNYNTSYYLLFTHAYARLTHAHARRKDSPFQPSKNCTRSHRGNQRKNKTKIHENASKTYSRMGSICV